MTEPTAAPPSGDAIRRAVAERYGALAREALGAAAPPADEACCAPADTACCATAAGGAGACAPGGNAREGGEGGEWGAALYGEGRLGAVPDAAQFAAAGCGDPVAVAGLRPGEAVLDLGSGGGIDCFLAARQVGPEGEVHGLDMTPDMVELARRNAAKAGADNVRFRLGEIEDMPFADATFDAVISNCVINLSADKPRVFREAFRVLRPGGRLRVSDVVLTADLPAGERADAEAWAGCIAGALEVGEYLAAVRAAGFAEVRADCGEDRRPGVASAFVTAVRPA